MDQHTDTFCPGCFADRGRANPCPHCGYDEAVERSPLVLPHRTMLHGQFVVGRVLGKPGGFGITYLGWDLNLQTQVAIKEFLPRDLAGRSPDRATVVAHSGDDGEHFRFGLEQFLREARTIAQLNHPNIVRVRHFFEANGTAYLVMDYYQGLSLAEYLDQQGDRIPEEQAKQLMLPILDGLRAVHAKGFLHRDIKPQNIYLARLDSGGVRPILLDFGAARQAMGERSRSLSVVITPGYAPFEQYQRTGRQTIATDIYAAAAVLYRMLTGITPMEAVERVDRDELRPATDFGISEQLSTAIAHAMAMSPSVRPQSVREFQALLTGKVAGVVEGTVGGSVLHEENRLPVDQGSTPAPQQGGVSGQPSSVAGVAAGITDASSKLGQGDGVTSTGGRSGRGWGLVALLMLAGLLGAGVAWRALDKDRYSETPPPSTVAFSGLAAERRIAEAEQRLRELEAKELKAREDAERAEAARRAAIEAERTEAARRAAIEAERAKAARSAAIEAERAADAQRAAQAATRCNGGAYQTSAQISALVTDRTAFGERIGTSKPYRWKEYQGRNGIAFFQRDGRSYTTGKWQINDDAICWCYGACQDYQCKRIWANEDCSQWLYVDVSSSDPTARVDRWEDGDKTN